VDFAEFVTLTGQSRDRTIRNFAEYRLGFLEYTQFGLSIALVPSEAASCGGAIMMKLRAIRAASFSLFFLLSGFALALAQAPPPEPPEPPSRLSMFAHDVTNWVDHIITDAKHIITNDDHISTDADHISTDDDHVSTGADRHRATHSPPLPRPRPAELLSAPVASSHKLSEFVSAPVASKKKMPTPVQIND
jgi:hypothetical protein